MVNNDILSRVFRYISFKPRTKQEVRKYLTRFNVSDEEVEKIIDYLSSNNLLDEDFVKSSYIDSRVSRGFGRRYIKHKLSSRGIEVEDGEIHFDLDRIVDVVLKRYRSYFGSEENLKLRSRIFNFLSYRGFTKDEINLVLKKIFGR
ncbi:MAG: regulatory protein RecX [Brevinematia bacterium]